MIVSHGFNATLTARPGMGDQLADLLLTGLSDATPGTSQHCPRHLRPPVGVQPRRRPCHRGLDHDEDHHRVFRLRSRSGHPRSGSTGCSRRTPSTPTTYRFTARPPSEAAVASPAPPHAGGQAHSHL